MRYIYIQGGEICGEGSSGENLPQGYLAISIPEKLLSTPLSGIYLAEDGMLEAIPTQPSSDHWWDKEAKEWREPLPLPEAPLAPDWEGFAAALRGGPIWAKFYTAGTKDLRCNLAGTLLLNTLTGTRNLADLEFAIAELLAAMAAASGVTELTTNQKNTLDGLLVEHRLKAAD